MEDIMGFAASAATHFGEGQQGPVVAADSYVAEASPMDSFLGDTAKHLILHATAEVGSSECLFHSEEGPCGQGVNRGFETPEALAFAADEGITRPTRGGPFRRHSTGNIGVPSALLLAGDDGRDDDDDEEEDEDLDLGNNDNEDDEEEDEDEDEGGIGGVEELRSRSCAGLIQGVGPNVPGALFDGMDVDGLSIDQKEDLRQMIASIQVPDMNTCLSVMEDGSGVARVGSQPLPLPVGQTLAQNELNALAEVDSMYGIGDSGVLPLQGPGGELYHPAQLPLSPMGGHVITQSPGSLGIGVGGMSASAAALAASGVGPTSLMPLPGGKTRVEILAGPAKHQVKEFNILPNNVLAVNYDPKNSDYILIRLICDKKMRRREKVIFMSAVSAKHAANEDGEIILHNLKISKEMLQGRTKGFKFCLAYTLVCDGKEVETIKSNTFYIWSNVNQPGFPRKQREQYLAQRIKANKRRRKN